MMLALSIIGGLILLTIGGEALVRGSVVIAERLNVPKLVIGLTLVGFGTSTPEMVTSINAALAGSPGIAIGNVVGSNICNILLILGLAAMISPMVAPWAHYRRDCLIMIGASLLFLALCFSGELTRLTGAVLFASLIAYLSLTFYLAQRDRDLAASLSAIDEDAPHSTVKSLPLNLGIAVFGLILLVFGADLLVDGSIKLAQSFNISDAIIGLTIVAVGTSLPELVTSVMAAIRRHADVAIGNVVGSNIFNILSILGVTAMIQPIDVPPSILNVDIWVMIGAAVLLSVLIMARGRISRRVGIGMFAGYAAYVGYLVSIA